MSYQYFLINKLSLKINYKIFFLDQYKIFYRNKYKKILR